MTFDARYQYQRQNSYLEAASAMINPFAGLLNLRIAK